MFHLDIINKFMMDIDHIQLAHGGGGKQSNHLISKWRNILGTPAQWTNHLDDGAIFDLGYEKLVFTTDSYTVDPLFFPGGDIGKLSMCGTINDLAVMGADPIGVSLAVVIEEGFSQQLLEKIMYSIKNVSEQFYVPVVTGDTKVMEKNKLDKIIINTSGLGLAKKNIVQNRVKPGDKVICSGTLGDHTLALLSKRFDYETDVISDCAPIINELKEIREYLTAAKDPTRGGIASVLNEISVNNLVGILLDESKIPIKKQTLSLCNLLGLNPYSLASEGRFVGCVSDHNVDTVIKKLQKYNTDACVIGEVIEGSDVYLETYVGKKKLEVPSGRLVPRIC